MTIGIGACGPNAGLAVFEALHAAELIGRGAIGGFVTYAALDTSGQLHRHQTQRGGTQTLFIDGEQTGVPPPGPVATATSAALISSGPERPEPLTQFLAADPGGGLVTGHRLPNGPSLSGRPLNVEALDHLLAGASAQRAVDAVVDANPEADVGLIAIDQQGGVYSRDSARVARRPDLGHARTEEGETGIVAEVLHNAIKPGPIIAQLAVAVAVATMRGEVQPVGWVTIEAGVPVELGEENAVYCDDDLVAQRVVTTDPVLIKGRQVAAGIYLHSRVYRRDEVIGLTGFEPIVTIDNGTIVEMSGQERIRMSYLSPSGN